MCIHIYIKSLKALTKIGKNGDDFMKSAKKLLAMLLAVIMLFSVMSVGMVAFAQTVTVGSQTGADSYDTTDDVIICVPETIYMRPGDTESVAGQYYVNNIVSSSGAVTLEAAKESTSGYISIYAPGSTAFSFTADAVAGSGIGDPIIGSTVNASTSTYENQRWENTALSGTTGYVRYDALQLYINGAGLTHGEAVVVEWKVTLYYGDDDTTGTTYYAYTTLYAPMRSVGAVAESRRTSNNNNEISSWITGVTGVGSRSSTLGSDRVGDDGTTADGYFTYDPLWTSTFGVGSSKSANDYVTESGATYVHAVAVGDDQYSRSIGYTGYLSIDASRYTNTNQVPNFRIGMDILRLGSNPKDSSDEAKVWYTLGKGNETIGTDEDAEPSGWTKIYDTDRGGSTGRIVSINPDYSVSEINGKYLHIASQVACTYLSTLNYANAYVSVVLSTTDKSDLRAAVIQATGLDETNYTKNSWSGATVNVIEEFHEALRNAAQVLGTPGAAQGIIDSALNTLRTKMNALMVTIKFDAGTNGGMFIDSETVKEYNIRFGSKTEVTVGSALLNYFNAVMSDGYVLAGWTTDPDADPTTASLDSVTVTFGDTLYAHYKKDISVDFNYLSDVSGNTKVINETLTIYNGANTALNAEVPEMTNVGIYEFAGWTTDPTSTEGVMLGDTIDGVTNSTAYYATYLKKLTLNLDLNGGTFDVTSVDGGVGYNYNLTETTGVATVTLPEEEPTKEGHGFEGWEINGTVYQPGDEVEFAGAATTATATAVWGVEKYNVTFNYKDANGKDVSITEQIEYGNSAVAPDAPVYYADTMRHYKFTGWDVAFDNITGDTAVTAQYNLGEGHSYTTEGTPNCDETVEVIYSCFCGYSYTITVEAGHKYELTDSKDATCEEDGYKTYVCQRDASHTYTEIINATGHSYENAVYVAPTCTEDGYYISGTCENCNEDLSSKTIPALGHTWVVDTEATCDGEGLKVCSGYTDENGEHHDCDATEVIPQLEHEYKYEITPQNCTEDGKIVYTCSLCGDSYEEVLPSTGHSYATIVFAPTCTSEGYTSQTCTTCGHSTKSNVVPALGHDYVDVVVAPTCTAQGYTKHTCSVCNYSYKTDFVDALGHDYSIETVVAPTCTARGYTLHECSACDSSYKTDYTDAIGHDYVYSMTVQPSGTQNGYELYICSHCFGEYKKTIYAGGEALVSKTLKGSDGNALSNATLILTNEETGETITITTDANGYFTHIIPEGYYTVTVSKSGYIADEGYITVINGVCDCDIPTLEKNPCDCLCHQDTFWAKLYRVLIKMFSIFGKIYCCDDSEIWS